MTILDLQAESARTKPRPPSAATLLARAAEAAQPAPCERDWQGGWGDADEISADEIDAFYPSPCQQPNPARRRPRFMFHVSRCTPGSILREGLRVDVERRFKPNLVVGFNESGVYLYDALPRTRRLFSRSHVQLYLVDTFGLELEQDALGGQGAWRSPVAIAPERVRHVHDYVPHEAPLATRHPLPAAGEAAAPALGRPVHGLSITSVSPVGGGRARRRRHPLTTVGGERCPRTGGEYGEVGVRTRLGSAT